MLRFSGHDAMWLLFVVSAIRAVGAAVQMPSVGALCRRSPEKADKGQWHQQQRSVRDHAVIAYGQRCFASMTTIEVIFFIDVVTAAMAVLTLLFFLKVPPHEKALSGSGMGYVRIWFQVSVISRIFDYVRAFSHFVPSFSFIPAAFLTPLQVARTFGSDVWRLTY